MKNYGKILFGLVFILTLIYPVSIYSQTCYQNIDDVSGVDFITQNPEIEEFACEIISTFEDEIPIGIFDVGLYSQNRAQGEVDQLIESYKIEAQSLKDNYILFIREVNSDGVYGDIHIRYNLDNSISNCLDTNRQASIANLFNNLSYTKGEEGSQFISNALILFESQLNSLIFCCDQPPGITNRSSCCIESDLWNSIQLTASMQDKVEIANNIFITWDPCDGWQTMSDKWPNVQCVGKDAWVPLCLIEYYGEPEPMAYGSIGIMDGVWTGTKSLGSLVITTTKLSKFLLWDNPRLTYTYYQNCHLHRTATLIDIQTIEFLVNNNDCNAKLKSVFRSQLSNELRLVTDKILKSNNPQAKLNELTTLFEKCEELDQQIFSLVDDWPTWNEAKEGIEQLINSLKDWDESFAVSEEVASYCRGKAIAQLLIEICEVDAIILGKMGSGAKSVVKILDNLGDNTKWFEGLSKELRKQYIKEGIINPKKPFKVPFKNLPKGLLDDYKNQPSIIKRFMNGDLSKEAWQKCINDPILRKNVIALEYIDNLKVAQFGNDGVTTFTAVKTIWNQKFPSTLNNDGTSKLVRHHGVEQQVLTKYPGVIKA
jgi:hypothetical protein